MKRWEILLALKALLLGSIIGSIIGIWTWENDDAR